MYVNPSEFFLKVNVLEKKNTRELNLGELFSILKGRWLIILVAAVVVAAAVFGYNKLFVTPMYRASAQLFVDVRKESSDEHNTYTNAANITAAKELANTYVHVIKTNTVLNQVIEELDLDMTYSQLNAKIAAKVVDETQILEIYVTDANKKRALDIVTKIVELAPGIINEKIDSSRLIQINDPEVSSSPVSPNVFGNTAIGFVAGFVLVYVYFLVMRLLDNKFKSAESIQRILDLPVLGVIPTVDKVTSK